jgi:hypothetical protein
MLTDMARLCKYLRVSGLEAICERNVPGMVPGKYLLRRRHPGYTNEYTRYLETYAATSNQRGWRDFLRMGAYQFKPEQPLKLW